MAAQYPRKIERLIAELCKLPGRHGAGIVRRHGDEPVKQGGEQGKRSPDILIGQHSHDADTLLTGQQFAHSITQRRSTAGIRAFIEAVSRLS